MVYKCRAQQLTPRYDLVTPGCVLAIDCEGVVLFAESSVERKGCGRVSIVTESEEVVLDTFVHYGNRTDVRPPPQRLDLGVKWADIKPWNRARYIDQVTRDVTRIFDRTGLIVGHAVENEIHMLRDVPWENYQLRDTQQMFWRETSSRKLSTIAHSVLGRNIQGGEHSSVEDARATMALWQTHQDRIMSANPIDTGIESEDDSLSEHSTMSASLHGSSATSLTEVDEACSEALVAHRKNIPSWIAPGHLVALPRIAGIAKGRKFDGRTPTYY